MWGTPQEPQQGDRFREQDAWNRRLIIRPIEYIPDIKKLDTRGDALKLNVVDLDDGGRLYQEILWFSGPLIGTFKNDLGTPFIGYITKEKNATGYMAWKFYSLAADPDTDAAAQAWVAAHPDFLAPLAPAPSAQSWQPDTSHHEQGPAPEWAGAVPARPAGPPAPPAPPAPPRPGQGFQSAPPPPRPGGGPVSAPPAPPVPAGGSLMERLRAQAAGVSETGGNVGSAEEQPPY